VLSASQASFAQRQRIAHFATADAEGQPHVVPICFVVMDGDFYFVIDLKPKRTTRLKRLRNIEENPNVALVIDRYDEDWSRLGWLMLQGVASVIESGPQHGAAVAALAEKYAQYRDMALDDRPIVRIVPGRVSSWGDLDEER
jgi:PPOX class probable F420-dependent enzyme